MWMHCPGSHGIRTSRQKVVKAIFKAAVEGPDALMEVYACHEKAISSLILESPPTWMTVMDWVQAWKVDPAINQVVTWIESKKLDTVKVGEEMSPELKQYLRQKGQMCLQEGVLYWWKSQARHGLQWAAVGGPAPNIGTGLEAMCGAHDGVGHLGLKRMFDLLCDPVLLAKLGGWCHLPCTHLWMVPEA